MKKFTRRPLSLFMVVVMIMSIMPIVEVSANTLSLDEIRRKFPNEQFWNRSNSGTNNPDGTTNRACPVPRTADHRHAYTYCNVFGGGRQCWGYADKVAFDYYGSNPNNSSEWWRNTNANALDSLKAGDIIRWGAGADGTHSVWVTAVNGENITYTDVNGGNINCQIRWDLSTTKSAVRARGLRWVQVAPRPLTNDNIYRIPITPETTSGNIPDGVYAIQGRGSGRYISTSVSTINGVVSYINDPGAGNGVLGIDQLFRLQRQSDNTYRITSVHSDKDLTVSAQSRDPRAEVIQWDWADYDNRRWYIQHHETANGIAYYRFVAKHSGLVLDVKNGATGNRTPLQQFEWNHSHAQQFRLIVNFNTSPSGYRDVTSEFANKTIAFQSTANNNRYIMADIGAGSSVPVRANSTAINSWEQFRTTLTADGHIGFRNVSNNKYISVHTGVKPYGLRGASDELARWESFRIFTDGTHYYLRSVAIGSWVYVETNESTAPLIAGWHTPPGRGRFKIFCGICKNETCICATTPNAPRNFTATSGNGQVTLAWTAPTSNGGGAITRYEVSSNGGATWVTASSSTNHTFTGLTNGTSYAFRVRAVNSAGNGTVASATATPTAPVLPGKPIIAIPKTTFTIGETVTISWDATANTSHFLIRIYYSDSDDIVRDEQITANSFSYEFGVGEYDVYVEAWNSSGATISDSICFSVISSAHCGGCGICEECRPSFDVRLYIDVIPSAERYQIKITNVSDVAISTKGMYLTDNNDLFQWQMPSFIIRQGEYILINGTENDFDSVLKRAKTNFNVALIERLLLTDATGNVLSVWESQ